MRSSPCLCFRIKNRKFFHAWSSMCFSAAVPVLCVCAQKKQSQLWYATVHEKAEKKNLCSQQFWPPKANIKLTFPEKQDLLSSCFSVTCMCSNVVPGKFFQLPVKAHIIWAWSRMGVEEIFLTPLSNSVLSGSSQADSEKFFILYLHIYVWVHDNKRFLTLFSLAFESFNSALVRFSSFEVPLNSVEWYKQQ